MRVSVFLEPNNRHLQKTVRKVQTYMTPPHFPILHKFAAQGLPDTEVFSCIEEHFVIFFLYFYPVLEPMHTEELMVL